MKRYYVFFAIIISIAIASGIAQAVRSAGNKQDSKRVADLETISNGVSSYASAHKALPAKLESLILANRLSNKLSDYDYRVKSYNKYELCTAFKYEARAPLGAQSTAPTDNPDVSYHKSGYQCWTYADPYLLPPMSVVEDIGSSRSCLAGIQDPKRQVADISWVGFDATAKTVTVKNGAGEQTFRWCAAPVVTNNKGYVIALSAISPGAIVTLQVTAPSTVNSNQTTSSGVPYVVDINVKSAESIK